MLKRVLQPQRFFKMWAAAAAVGLIAVMAIASPANARFTLEGLDGGQSFTVGDVTFYNWSFDASESTVDLLTSSLLTSTIRSSRDFLSKPLARWQATVKGWSTVSMSLAIV